MVLLDERTGRYWQLNGTGAHILRALLDGGTPDGVAEALAARVEAVSREQIAADVRDLLDRLAAARLTEGAPAAG
ncbi:lasso peptide biosynthesis PqqD family chaperone [Streptomyces hoynatensis]|uniref:Lasso peptide biosynthesis PqqD family chaperone n=2 Tax=Streptomyces hoynatensis TaxID=1141874 RepID=A0A3A9Z9D5_9ACTN|nr:lasso peptide biosynthesis PqqD family chaperone [Streptomyces hoynatensis]